MDELLTQVTDDDEIIGPVLRSLVHGNPSLIHRSVHVLVFNSNGKLLLQKRSMLKDTQPGKWDTSVGGHVGFGQSYLEAAHRETEEELGITLKNPQLLYPSRIRDVVESENIHTFLEITNAIIRHDPEEIDEVYFWCRAEIEAKLGSHIFTSNFEEEFVRFVNSEHGFILK